MQTDTNSSVVFEADETAHDDVVAIFLKKHQDILRDEENEDYTLELNSNKDVCLITFKSARTQVLSKASRLQILSEKIKAIDTSKIEPFRSNVEEIFNIISTLEFEDAIIEVSPFNSLIFKLKFPQGIFLIINIPEENLNRDNPTAVFSLLDNRQTIIDNYNTLDSIVIGMESFLEQ